MLGGPKLFVCKEGEKRVEHRVVSAVDRPAESGFPQQDLRFPKRLPGLRNAVGKQILKLLRSHTCTPSRLTARTSGFAPMGPCSRSKRVATTGTITTFHSKPTSQAASLMRWRWSG